MVLVGADLCRDKISFHTAYHVLANPLVHLIEVMRLLNTAKDFST